MSIKKTARGGAVVWQLEHQSVNQEDCWGGAVVWQLEHQSVNQEDC